MDRAQTSRDKGPGKRRRCYNCGFAYAGRDKVTHLCLAATLSRDQLSYSRKKVPSHRNALPITSGELYECTQAIEDQPGPSKLLHMKSVRWDSERITKIHTFVKSGKCGAEYDGKCGADCGVYCGAKCGVVLSVAFIVMLGVVLSVGLSVLLILVQRVVLVVVLGVVLSLVLVSAEQRRSCQGWGNRIFPRKSVSQWYRCTLLRESWSGPAGDRTRFAVVGGERPNHCTNCGCIKTVSTKRHGELLPNNIICLIVGPSNCGKTTLMIDNFIYAQGWLDFGTLYVCSKSLDQLKYINLKKDIGIPSKLFNEGIGYFFMN
ncbi:hypothetical protein PR048_020264 [Dryococelus australis]|uniref:Uncharacterized protein n=1 Tax=Dryococelus australis TaxID=614101 RepID=A0ABQ9H5U0_9NEOP|nr:hypothetical protein PR048_020264 [Dryococelus australis]